MQQPIGQTRLLNIIDSYTAKTLPKTILFVGDLGCGKKTFAKYIANKFEFDFVEIESSVSSEDIQSFLYSTLNTVYLINLDRFTDKQQNQFLKFIEEPSKTVYTILTASSETTVLPTILNRCIKHRFDNYTLEQLCEITGSANINPMAIEIFKTPGKLINLTDGSFKAILSLAENVVYKTAGSNYANLLAVSTKINFKDLYSKVDFYLFFDTVEYLAFKDFITNGTPQSFTVFKITNQFKQYAMKQNLVKETLMLNYLTTLWEAVHDASRA